MIAKQYRVGERVMVCMPGDVSGKTWKLARPYHGLFRILSLTPTNAEVQLIENPGDPSLLSRLMRCYPEMTNASWTGQNKAIRDEAPLRWIEPKLVLIADVYDQSQKESRFI